jgi:hypothetical protein
MPEPGDTHLPTRSRTSLNSAHSLGTSAPAAAGVVFGVAASAALTSRCGSGESRGAAGRATSPLESRDVPAIRVCVRAAAPAPGRARDRRSPYPSPSEVGESVVGTCSCACACAAACVGVFVGVCLCCDCRLTVAAPRLCRPRAQRWLGARRLSTPGTIVRWRGDIAGAPERARWAGARALCRVLRRVRVFDSAWWWIPVDSRVVLSCELFLYVWFLQVYFCAGGDGSRVARLQFSRVRFVWCVLTCDCAYARARACPLVKCARVYVLQCTSAYILQYMPAEFLCVCVNTHGFSRTRACVHVRGC